MNRPTDPIRKVSDLYAAAYVLTRCRFVNTEWTRSAPGARSYVKFIFENPEAQADAALAAYANGETVNARDYVTALRSLRELVFTGRQNEEKGL